MKDNSLSPTQKVLLTAYIGSENLGDEAICESLIHDLTKERIEITAVSKNTEKTEKLGVPAVRLFSLRFFTSLINADGVLLGGGGLLQDETSIYNIPYFIIQILLAQLLRKKTMFVAIGAGPLKGSVGKLLISLAIKKTDVITVRDRHSYNVLKKLGADEEAMHLVTDPAIALSYDTSGELNAIPITFTENDYIVVCLRHWFDLNRFLPVALSNKVHVSYSGRCSYKKFTTTIAQCLDTIIEETSQRAIFFPFYGNRDITVNRDTYEKMKYKNKTFLINEPQELSTFYPLVKNAQFVISMRLHAAIISAAQHTPCIALSYSIKVKEFMKSLGMERFALDLKGINEESMIALAREIAQDKTALHAEIKKSVIRLQEAHRKNIDIILDHLTNN